MSEPRVIDSDPWWSPVIETIKKPALIIGSSILLLIIVGFVLSFFLLRDSEAEKVLIDYSKALIVTDERDLWVLNLSNYEKKLIQRTTKGISSFDIYKKNIVFWSELNKPWINSLSKYPNLTQNQEWYPTAAAVDFVTGKLYVLDSCPGKLSVFDMKSSNYGIAVTDLKDPVDLALDPLRGVMFIVQKSNSVVKGNMDGTSIQKVISSESVIAVAVDTQTPKLYWSDKETIVSSDYNGKNTRIVVIASTTSLGVSGNRIFWTSPPDSSNNRNLWNCWLIGDTGICDSQAVQKIDFDDPKAIKVYAEQPYNIKNPCQYNNGNCQQLCLLTSQEGHTCACYIGYKLKDDLKTCEPINDYVLYVQGDFIRRKIIGSDKKSFNEAFLPIRLKQTLELRMKPAIDFDYNFYTNTLILSDDNFLINVNLSNGDDRISFRNDGYFRNVACDWITNDTYYLNDNFNNFEKSAIIVTKQENSNFYRKTLQFFDQNVGHLKYVVLHPNSGVYFFSVLHNTNVTQIYKVTGLNKISTILQKDYDAHSESQLAIDYTEERIYWFSQNLSLIHHANFNGEDVKSVNVSMVMEPRSLYIYRRDLYVANLSSIWRLDKSTGRGAVKIIPNLENDELIAGVKVFSREVQTIKPEVPCAEKNGGCEQFCFRAPIRIVSGANTVEDADGLQKKCLCEDNKTIFKDGRSCV